jgi:hypothetical protein
MRQLGEAAGGTKEGARADECGVKAGALIFLFGFSDDGAQKQKSDLLGLELHYVS